MTTFFRFLMLSALALALAGVVADGGPKDATPAVAGFQEVARPFIQLHCLACHGEKKALAGFRIDLLVPDFARPKVAEHWKEVIDRINAGEMPPKGKPRPDAKQAAGFVDWVNLQLREVELAAKNAGDPACV